MGTRAQFFIGDPSDASARQWLGCVAWDGYPDGDVGKALRGAVDEGAFKARVGLLQTAREDFCDPAKHSFPFPWTDDLYLTDFTYAFFDGRVQVTCYHGGWRDLARVMNAEKDDEIWSDVDELPGDVPAPDGDGPKGPDSIMFVTATK